MMKIYGGKMSSAGRCWWAAAEAGVELEQIPLDFQKNEHKSAEYLAINPNGKVPTLVDGDIVIWESMAINNYILEKHKPDLFGPMDAGSHAQLLQWSYWSLAHLNKALEPLYMQKYRGPLPAEEVPKHMEELDKWMKILDAHLAGKDYMVGNVFTIADINVGSVASAGKAFNMDYAPYPNVQRWMATLAARPAFQSVYGA
jgi:glutathione S-transferase